MAYKITIAGADGVVRTLDGTKKIPNQAVRDLAQFIHNKARLGAGRHFKTGALEQSTYIRRLQEGWQVGHDAQRAPHAGFVHFGTRPHLIKPSKKKSLRWPQDARFIFARTVHHPGYKGDPWLFRAVDEVGLRFNEIVNNSIKKVAE